MIEVERLTKRYGEMDAVSDLTFTVAAGELFVFLGPNGAGKSSTIKMLTGQLPPTAGTARIAGARHRPPSLGAEAGHRLHGRAALPLRQADRPRVPPLRRRRLRGPADASATQRTATLLRLFELEAGGRSLIETYSQGMRQKIALASVLIHQPSVLFLDEPTNGLDPRSARIVKDVLRDICRARGDGLHDDACPGRRRADVRPGRRS